MPARTLVLEINRLPLSPPSKNLEVFLHTGYAGSYTLPVPAMSVDSAFNPLLGTRESLSRPGTWFQSSPRQPFLCEAWPQGSVSTSHRCPDAQPPVSPGSGQSPDQRSLIFPLPSHILGLGLSEKKDMFSRNFCFRFCTTLKQGHTKDQETFLE